MIGKFEDILPEIFGPVEQWLNEIKPEVIRLAFGAALYDEVEDKVTGYKKLDNFLRYVEIDPEGSSDFSYAINRPRELSIKETVLKINRMSKWTVSAFMHVSRPLPSSEGVSVVTQSTKTIANACKLELDINTSPSDEVINNLTDVLSNLVSQGIEILNEGDIK